MENGFFGLQAILWYPFLAIGLFVAMVLLVPREHIKRFFAHGIIFGIVVGTLFTLVWQALDIYQYHRQGPFSWFGANAWLTMAWTATMIIFLNFLPTTTKPYLYWGYIVGMAMTSSFLSEIFHQMGLLEYVHWNAIWRLIIGFIWFWATAAAYHKWGDACKEPKDR